MKKKIPFWVKFILVLLALKDCYKIRPVLCDDVPYDWWIYGKYRYAYGNFIQSGRVVYTIYYSILFKPFRIRDWPIFDVFIDPL